MKQPASDTETETTQILYGAENIIKFNLQRFSRIKEKHDAFLNSAWPSVIFTVAEPIKTALIDLKKKGIKQRLITEITCDNIAYCRELLKFMEIRHLDGIKGNFSVSDEREYVAIATIRKEQDIDQLIFTNVKQIVEQHQYLFETLWNKAIPSEDKIKEIEQGIKPDVIETIKDPIQIRKLYLDLIKSAKNELMLIIPTSNAIHRQANIGIPNMLNKIGIGNNVNVRLLAPLKNENYVEQELQVLFSPYSSPHIQLRSIETASATKSTIAIVDKKESLVIEVKDDSKEAFSDAMGFATYSNSRPTVLSYISIFESFWLQTEMYKKVKEAEQMQKDFINIAAHELRNPIQPILSLTEIARRKASDRELKELLDIVVRNANILKQLTEDVLDVTRIESNSFQLNKEGFNLKDLILDIIEAYKRQILKKSIIDIKLICDNDNSNNIIIHADKYRVHQVISNLISNAVKFTHGTISINIKKSKEDN
ncbi:MAG TPA: HAMP domain-containing sensor histidine kinase, partial [Nitrososphaeraceae archaeon]|nr:HAMP domain-containing sensor histidine kinase [Nitrososphaeraceae archaeon]